MRDQTDAATTPSRHRQLAAVRPGRRLSDQSDVSYDLTFTYRGGYAIDDKVNGHRL
jgi:hypothetical protein